jgi:SAM-dependent methyltransferase
MKSLRKVFLPADHAGGSTHYWEAQWLDELRPFTGVTARLLKEHLSAPNRLLEAGCGQGEVAAGLASLGIPVIGVDLAIDALTACRARHPELPLVVGDVGRLPFRDQAFDAIVSLGVVEHFEAGPVPVLKEHTRVATHDALVFLTVPARGWYRRWSDLYHLRFKRERLYRQRNRMVGLRARPVEEAPDGLAFHQYEFPRRMIQRMCDAAGLEVEHWQPFGVAWALGDSPALAHLVSRISPNEHGVSPVDASQPIRPESKAPSSRSMRSYLRTAVIDEDGSDPVQRFFAWSAAHALGHMQLLIARPRARTKDTA